MIAFLSNLLIKGLWLQWRTFILSGDTSFRSSHRRCSLKTGVLRNFAKSIGKHPCQSLFVNEVTGLGLRPATLLKKRIWHRCFPVNFAKDFKNTYFTEHLWVTSDFLHSLFVESIFSLIAPWLLFLVICSWKDYSYSAEFSYLSGDTLFRMLLRCSIKKGVLRKYAKFTGKHLCQSLFFNKKESLAQMFSCEICEFLRTSFLQNTSGTLRLII